MNWPNRLTVARLGLTVLLVACLSAEWRFGSVWAFGLFILAAGTDYLDGWLARRFGWITPFGQLMDPLVDKILMSAVFICLILPAAIPAWAVIVIISREFLITGLRLLAAGRGVVLPAEKLGKHKTAWQMITALVLLLLEASEDLEWSLRGMHPLVSVLAAWLVGVTVFLTLVSGLAYLWKHRDLLADGNS